jgi:cell division protein FtsN
MVARLERDGYSARILSGSLHRVVVGEFETEDQARRLAALLAHSGYSTYIRRLR